MFFESNEQMRTNKHWGEMLDSVPQLPVLVVEGRVFDLNNKNRSTGLLSATVPKRENAWNTIEPGDPYDIRK